MAYGSFSLKTLTDIDETYDPEFTDNNNVTKKVKDYYKFLGWSTQPYAKTADYLTRQQYQGGLTTTAGEIVNLYAVWVKQKDKGADITFYGNGNEEAPASYVAAADEVVFDQTEKVGEEEVKFAYYNLSEQTEFVPVREGLIPRMG